MEAFGIMGMTFGIIGFVLATQLQKKLKALETRLEAIESEQVKTHSANQS